MKNKMTIEFRNQEDLVWAVLQIERAREYVATNGLNCGTPLSGGSAAILLSALGRSKIVKSAITQEQAHNIVVGRVAK